MSGDEDDKKGRRTKAETNEFVYALMGPDGYWEKFTKNRTEPIRTIGERGSWKSLR
jgi:hypothetical protein